MNFEDLFISEQKPYKGKSQRDKFLSRIFGIFNEEIVRIWCANTQSPFNDLGRPTVYDIDGKHYTLDFLLRDCSGNIFVTEMKCEIEYQKYKGLILSKEEQLHRHLRKRAFQLLLEIASRPEAFQIKCQGEEINVSGSALIWGKVSEEGATEVKHMHSLTHVLSTESIITDLIDWKDYNYLSLLNQYESWCDQLFTNLKG